MVGHSTSGLFLLHYQSSSSSSTLWLLPMASSQYPSDYPPFYDSPPSVDCTLSLGTPSTRRSSDPSFLGNTDNAYEHYRHSGRSSSNFFSNLQSSTYYGISGDHTISNKHTAINASSGGTPPVVRCCAICDTTATPLWRKGPKGPKTLCNACGIRFKKVERRAKAAAAAAATNPLGDGGIEMGKATKPERDVSATSRRRRKIPGGSGTTGFLSSSPSFAD